MFKMTKLIMMLYAFVYYIYCATVGPGWNRFYKKSQEANLSFTGRAIKTFLDSSLKWAFLGSDFVWEDGDRDRISPQRLAMLLADPTHKGYAELTYDKSMAHLPIEQQQRGFILPLLEQAITEFEAETGRPPHVLEIGTANGDVLAKLAQDHPGISFTGLDLTVENAVKKYPEIKNVSFIGGYSLDVLEKDDAKYDIVFGSSTYCLFLPKELRNYIRAFKKVGASYILISEPCFYDFEVRDSDDATSMHVLKSTWFHNYGGYLKQEGYVTTHLEHRPFRMNDPKKIRVTLLAAKKQ